MPPTCPTHQGHNEVNMNQCPHLSKLKTGKGCKITSCRHNMFWDELKLPKKSHEISISLADSNCMYLLKREMTLDDIGKMWGITRERVRQIERDAIIKLLSPSLWKNSFLKELDLDEDFLREKLDFLKTKKINRAR